MTRDVNKFAEAHAALEEMLEEEVPKVKIPRTRSSQIPRHSSSTPKTKSDLPLFLFVVPDFKYDEWNKPQVITVSIALGTDRTHWSLVIISTEAEWLLR